MNDISVKFYDDIEIEKPLLSFVVIVSKYDGKWVLCRHKKRNTLEVPGGHIEEGESMEAAARRELYEETGAVKSRLKYIGIYGVKRANCNESFGALYFAEIEELGELPESEISQVVLLDEFPTDAERLTYPAIQPRLMEFVECALKKA